MNPSGKFIVIEGPDGSGKETQQGYLCTRLETDLAITPHKEDFPQYESSFFGEIVGEMLAGNYGPARAIHPMLSSLPFAFDRWQAKPRIEKALEKGQIVIANRYTLSNMAHQSALLPVSQRPDFIKRLQYMEYEVLKIPKPDFYIHLDVPPEHAQKFIEAKTARKYLGMEVKKDLLEADIEHQMEAYKMYKVLSQELPGITTIDCSDGLGGILLKEEIHELVWCETQKFLGLETREGGIKGERQI